MTDPTPGPDTGAIPTEMNNGNTSQAIAVAQPMQQYPLPPVPPSNGNLLNQWWKQLVAFCIGLGAFGVVAYGVASRFFVSTEKFQTVENKINKTNAALDRIEDKLKTYNVNIQKNTKAVHSFELIVAAEGLSADAAKQKKRRHRRSKN